MITIRCGCVLGSSALVSSRPVVVTKGSRTTRIHFCRHVLSRSTMNSGGGSSTTLVTECRLNTTNFSDFITYTLHVLLLSKLYWNIELAI